MTYTEIMDTIKKAMADKDVDKIVGLINHTNRSTIDRHRLAESNRNRRYIDLQKKFKFLDGKDFEEMDKIFNSGLSKDEIERELGKIKK